MEKAKSFWVMSVNNYICDASYSGKELKKKHFMPSFRRFHFIRNNDLTGFSKRSEITNEELVKKLLSHETTNKQ